MEKKVATAKRRLQSQTGSAIVEAVISLTAMTIVVSGFLIAGYTGFAKLWIRRSSYEAVICLAAKENQGVCREKLNNRIQGVFPSLVLKHTRLVRTQNLAHVQFEAELLNGLTLREARSLQLPLKLARRDR